MEKGRKLWPKFIGSAPEVGERGTGAISRCVACRVSTANRGPKAKARRVKTTVSLCGNPVGGRIIFIKMDVDAVPFSVAQAVGVEPVMWEKDVQLNDVVVHGSEFAIV